MAESRTIKIISMIRLLGNCSNRLAYEYTEKDVGKIFGAIESALGDAKKRFKNTPNGTALVFSLSQEKDLAVGDAGKAAHVANLRKRHGR